jgi:hypothetical protein
MASRKAMARFANQEGNYSELGGEKVEAIANALGEPLGLSVELYDDDTHKYIDGLYQVTVDLTISFSILILAYYFIFIYTILTKLRETMLNEFNFYCLLPRPE